MQTILRIFILTFLASKVFAQENRELFPITDGKLFGYIDKTGKTVIQPKFYAAGSFSEGLAAVRLSGTYGYIDKSGSFLIKPQFDLALPFLGGLAKVFIDGKPFIIDKKGNILFQHNFEGISSFGNSSYAIVVTRTDKYGVINRQGKLIADTVFKRINSFVDGVAVVYGLNHLPYATKAKPGRKYEVGLIDTTGRWIIPYGRYIEIDDFKNGYSKVKFPEPEEKGDELTDKGAVIDPKGNQRFMFPAKKHRFDYQSEGFYDGVAVAEIRTADVDTIKDWAAAKKTNCLGAIDTDGNVLFWDASWTQLTPFTCNRAFAFDVTQKWKLIDKTGKQIGDTYFDKIFYNTYRDNPGALFVNGIAWVKLYSGWVEIDTNGRFLSQPNTFGGIDDNRMDRVGDLIFFEQDISGTSSHYSFRYGFWNAKNNSTIAPTYHDIDRTGFNDELIYAMKDGKDYYINSGGQVIWQQDETAAGGFTNLNIDFMNRGYFYAYSKPAKEDIGGFAPSDNFQKKISKSGNFHAKELSVVVHPELKGTIYEHSNAMTVYVANTTGNEIQFNAQDSRLYMKVQALNSKGEWKDIEYLPSSWCGNSYHTLALKSKHFWTFQTPVYEGEFKTRLRIELTYVDPDDHSKNRWDRKQITVYSNEYEGSINPGQFWNKRAYYPRGIMDPYND